MRFALMNQINLIESYGDWHRGLHAYCISFVAVVNMAGT